MTRTARARAPTAGIVRSGTETGSGAVAAAAAATAGGAGWGWGWGWVGAGIARQAGWQSWVQVRECRVSNSGTEHALSVVCPAGETTGIATTGGGTTGIAMTGGGMIATATTGAAAAPPTMHPHTTLTGGATDWVYCASHKLWMLCSYNLACSQVSNAMQRQAQNRRPNPAHPQNDSDLLGSKHWLPASPRCFTAWVPFQSRC